MLRTNRYTSNQRWFWSIGIGLGLTVVAIVCVFLIATDRPPAQASVQPVGNEPNALVSSSLPITEAELPLIEVFPQLPQLDFPPGSVEEACGLNDLPPRVGYYKYENREKVSLWVNNPFANTPFRALDSEACRIALENHLSTINPYLWGETESDRQVFFVTHSSRQFAFVELDNPLTFQRIFADPAADLAQVRDALSRPECWLEPGKKNWELKESCHADAFLNFALLNRFCFSGGVDNRTRSYYWEEDNPTPEQDRLMWKQTLEDAWVEEMCEELNPMLELTSEQHSELYLSVMSLSYPSSKSIQELLIELAARLGDNAAGLALPIHVAHSHYYHEEGYKHGRFAELLSSDAWKDFAIKKAPSTDRFLQTFQMLARVTSRKADPRDEFELDWQWVAQYLCAPPYYQEKLKVPGVLQEELEPHHSCAEIVHEIRQSGTTFRPLLDVLDKFEQVALELEVYE